MPEIALDGIFADGPDDDDFFVCGMDDPEEAPRVHGQHQTHGSTEDSSVVHKDGGADSSTNSNTCHNNATTTNKEDDEEGIGIGARLQQARQSAKKKLCLMADATEDEAGIQLDFLTS